MTEKKTRYDILLDRIKNNPVTVTLLIIGTVIISIGAVVSAIVKISDLQIYAPVRENLELDISGRWVSEIKPHYYLGIKNYYKYILEIKQIGDSFTGILIKKFDDISRVEKNSIIRGTIQDNTLKFYTKGEYYKTTSDTTALGFKKAEYMVNYHGKMVGDEIHFVGQDDRGYSPVDFSLIEEK